MTKRKPKRLAGVDRLALAEIQAASIERSTQLGRPLTKKQESWWSPDLAAVLQRRHAVRGYAIRGRFLQRAQTDDRLSVQALALKVVETLDDRLLGKPQAVMPTNSHVTVVLTGGIDPSRLPEGPVRPLSKPVVDVMPAASGEAKSVSLLPPTMRDPKS